MLSMFGFIKKELDDQGKLPGKFGGWKNTLWIDDMEVQEDSIAYSNPYKYIHLFKSKSEKLPFEAFAKPWDCQIGINISYVLNGTETQTEEHQFRMDLMNSSHESLFAIKIQGSEFVQAEYFKALQLTKGALASAVSKGANYLRITWNPTSTSSIKGTLTTYYSKNGKSWTKLGSYSYTGSENRKFASNMMITITPRHMYATYIPGSLRFVYDGKVLYQK